MLHTFFSFRQHKIGAKIFIYAKYIYLNFIYRIFLCGSKRIHLFVATYKINFAQLVRKNSQSTSCYQINTTADAKENTESEFYPLSYITQ